MELTGKNVMVTGGAGFIGSHLVDKLIESGCSKVVAVDNLYLGKEKNLEGAKATGKLVFYNANAADENAMKKIINEHSVKAVFNLAVVPLPASLEQPVFGYMENIEITSAICELLRKDCFETLVQYSSSEAYGTAKYAPMDEGHPLNPRTPYAASKAASDHLVTSYHYTYGTDTVIVRPFNNYGPRQNEGTYAAVIPLTIKRILDGKAPIIYGDGLQTRDYVYVEDTADATVKIFENVKTRGKAINLGSGEETVIKDLIEKINSIVGGKEPIQYAPPRIGDVDRHIADISLAKKLIGYSPKTDWDVGLKKTISWYLNQTRIE